MCGSGTFPIEAASIAGDIAPGLGRDYFGFLGWKRHDQKLWSTLTGEAKARCAAGARRLPPISGFDQDADAVANARRNVRRARLEGRVRIERRAVAECRISKDANPGLVVINPPYGERLDRNAALPDSYRALGQALKRCYPGWRAAVFTGYPEAARHLGLQAHRKHTLYNGALACKLFHYRIHRGSPAAAAHPIPAAER
jgi:23S rRNA (guanine2445-N2)-methyltransferase / 23S rRNA (guanine2069-N7)-methyltransferase